MFIILTQFVSTLWILYILLIYKSNNYNYFINNINNRLFHSPCVELILLTQTQTQTNINIDLR